MRCDGCAEPIVGPRLQCVHCEVRVDLCVGCAARDAGGATRLRLRDGRRHPRRHVFRRVRQKVLGYDAPSEARLAAGGGGTSAGASSLQQEDLLELTANHVDMRPGLGTAAAAAARAAEVRALEARTAAAARAAAAAAAPARSASASSGAAAHQRGRKRAAPQLPLELPPSRRGAQGGAPSASHGPSLGASQASGGGNSPIVLSSDED